MSASARFFAIALGIGLLLRLGLILLAAADPAILMYLDQLDYIRLADIVNQQGLGLSYGAERMPGYPLFLALCSRLAPGGEAVAATFGLHALLLAVVVQHGLGGVAIYCIQRLGGLLNRTTANLAGGFAALDLNMAVYSNQILTDALFYPLFAGFLYLFFLYQQSGRKRHLVLMAAALGVATMVRSVTMYLPLLVLFVLFFFSAVIGFRERLRRVALFAGIFLLAVSPWLGRNHLLYGHAAMTTQGQGHIIGWVIPGIAQYEARSDLSKAVAESSRRWREHLASLPPAAQTDPFLLDREAKEWFRDYLRTVSPVSVAKAWFWGAVKNLFAPMSVELAYIFRLEWTHFYDTPGTSFPEQAFNFIFHNSNRLYAALLLVGIGLTLLFRLAQLFGVWRLCRLRRDFGILLLLFVAYFLGLSGPVGQAKYRLPFEPLLVLLSAVAAGALPPLRREAVSLPDGEGGERAAALPSSAP